MALALIYSKSFSMRNTFKRMKRIKRQTELEDKEITRIYDKAYSTTEERAKDSELAEEMFAASAVHEEEDNW